MLSCERSPSPQPVMAGQTGEASGPALLEEVHQVLHLSVLLLQQNQRIQDTFLLNLEWGQKKISSPD